MSDAIARTVKLKGSKRWSVDLDYKGGVLRSKSVLATKREASAIAEKAQVGVKQGLRPSTTVWGWKQRPSASTTTSLPF